MQKNQLKEVINSLDGVIQRLGFHKTRMCFILVMSTCRFVFHIVCEYL